MFIIVQPNNTDKFEECIHRIKILRSSGESDRFGISLLALPISEIAKIAAA